MKMCHHLTEYQLECISLYRNCYDYSPEHYDEIMAFVTKLLLIETAIRLRTGETCL